MEGLERHLYIYIGLGLKSLKQQLKPPNKILTKIDVLKDLLLKNCFLTKIFKITKDLGLYKTLGAILEHMNFSNNILFPW